MIRTSQNEVFYIRHKKFMFSSQNVREIWFNILEYGRRLVVEWVNNVSTVIILLYRSEIFQFEIGAKRKTKVLRGG